MKISCRILIVLCSIMLEVVTFHADAQLRRRNPRDKAVVQQETLVNQEGTVTLVNRNAIPPRRRVLDVAGILLPNQERDLEGKIWRFENQTHAHVAILVANEFERGKPAKSFALLAKQNRITAEERANSVLIVVFVHQRVGRIEVGNNLQSALPVALRKRIIQQRIMRRFKAGQIYAGVNAGLVGVMMAIKPDFQLYQVSTTPGTVLVNPALVESSTDTIPPTITVTQPTQMRGMKLESKEKTILVKGTATDASGVFEVSVNGVEANLAPGGDFSAEVRLAVGDNIVSVKAVDTKNNVAETHFTMTRDAVEQAALPESSSAFGDSTLRGEGKYYALVIGIDKYTGEWPQLTNAAHDASSIAEELRTDYKFDKVTILLDKDATRSNIIRQMEWLTENVQKHDNVVIFYSGHGDFKKTLNKGFWVPVDAQTESAADFISNSDIQTFLGGIPSKHTLLIADACFSGDIFRGLEETVKRDDAQRYYEEVGHRASRQAMSSGGLEPVMDGGRDGHSVFTYYLLKALKDNAEKNFDAGQLYDEIKIPIANNSDQTPIFSAVKNTGDEGGQFVFQRK